jgi:general secretion pathway protein A
MGERKVNNRILDKAAREVLESPRHQGHKLSPVAVVAAMVLIVVSIVFAATRYNKNPEVASVQTDTPAAEAATPEQTALPDKLIPPAGLSTEQSRSMALSSLFDLWGISYKSDETTSACWQSRLQGLACLRGLGSLNNLKIMNRPAMLRLYTESGVEYYATLSSLNNETASLTVGNVRLDVPVKDIESQWLGDYILLWKPPPEYSGEIQPGDRGPSVRWLDRQLSLINGREPSQEELLSYDKSLIKEVKRFQLAEGLVPDGIVGTQTIIHINTANSENVPTLADNRER